MQCDGLLPGLITMMCNVEFDIPVGSSDAGYDVVAVGNHIYTV